MWDRQLRRNSDRVTQQAANLMLKPIFEVLTDLGLELDLGPDADRRRRRGRKHFDFLRLSLPPPGPRAGCWNVGGHDCLRHSSVRTYRFDRNLECIDVDSIW